MSYNPAPGAGWTLVAQAADAVVNNTTTYQNSSLAVPIAAGARVRLRGLALIDTGATADFKFQFTGPASPTLVRINVRSIACGATALGNIRVETGFAQSRAVAGTGTTGGMVEFDGVVLNGANAGTITLQWGANALEVANTTLRAGSYVEYQTA